MKISQLNLIFRYLRTINQFLILIECTMSDTTHHEAKEASSATQVIIYVLLFVILAIFGDTFVFILGTIGLAVVAAATYSAPAHEEGHH
jgi:hypothetical protein